MDKIQELIKEIEVDIELCKTKPGEEYFMGFADAGYKYVANLKSIQSIQPPAPGNEDGKDCPHCGYPVNSSDHRQYCVNTP